MQRAIQAGVVALVLLTASGCSSGDGDDNPTPDAPIEAVTAAATSSASVSTTPYAQADQSKDVSAAHLDIVEASGRIDGDRVLGAFRLAGLPDDLERSALPTLDRFMWRIHVRNEAAGPPAFVIDVNPRLPGPGTFSASGAALSYEAQAYEVSPTDPSRPPLNFWPARIDIDFDAKVVSVAARLPNLGPQTQIQLVTYRFAQGQYEPVESDETSYFVPDAMAFTLGSDLPTPVLLAGETQPDGSQVYDLTGSGMPLRFVAPAGWIANSQLQAGTFAASPAAPTTEVMEMGVRLVNLDGIGGVETAEAILARIIEETSGAYEVVPDAPPFALPAGFEASALISVVQPFQVAEAPGKLLRNWSSMPGSTLRLVIAKTGGTAMIGYLESSDWSAAEPALMQLSQWVLTD